MRGRGVAGTGRTEKAERTGEDQEDRSRQLQRPWHGAISTGQWPLGVQGGTTEGCPPGKAEGQEEETEMGLGPPCVRKGTHQNSLGGGRGAEPAPRSWKHSRLRTHLAELSQQPQRRQLPVAFQQVVRHVQVPQLPQLLQAWGGGEQGGRACMYGGGGVEQKDQPGHLRSTRSPT